MTDAEIAALRQKVREWQAGAASAPTYLLAMHKRLVEACPGMVSEGGNLPVGGTVKVKLS